MVTTLGTDARLAVVGSGYMGGGMAQIFAICGFHCTLGDVSAEHSQASLERIIAEAQAFEDQGLFPAASTAAVRARVSAAPSIEDAVHGARYVAEAVPEQRDIKAAALERISATCPPDAIIATNTSAMPIGELAEYVQRAERFLGVHWMNPAPFVPGVEIIPASGTADDVVDTAEALMLACGKSPARVSDHAGFVANRLQYALFHEAARMVEEGSASPAQIDAVVSNSFGFRLPFFGPFATADMAGLDVYVGAYDSFHAAYGDRFQPPALLTERVAAGDLGLKSGGGFTGMDATRLAEIVEYRNRAYTLLKRMRDELGPVPGSASSAQ